MPSVPCLQTLQRELADSIIRCAPLDELRILLACGAKVNEPVTQGLRPLHYAAYQQYIDAVYLLLVRGSEPDAMDDVGYTALHLCAERGYNDLIEVLLKHGARVCFTELGPDDKALGNPPRATLADEPLRLAIKNGHYDCAELLLRNGADPNARYFLGAEINLISPLNVPFIELMLRYGADPDARDRSGLTPLMKACRHPQGIASARLLIKYGADVNAITSERHDYRTVLHYGVLSGNIDTVILLMNCGASVHYPVQYKKPSPLDFAILRGNVDLVRLLLNSGADVNTGSPIIGAPLHIALSEKVENRMELVQILLEHGADPNVITMSDNGPLLKPPLGEYFNSVEIPDLEVVQLLLRYGAKVILKAQLQHPLGILKTLHRLGLAPGVFDAVVDASEAFNVASIKRSLLLSDDQRQSLLEHASQPLTLKRQSRVRLREWMGVGKELMKKISCLPIPRVLKMYLLYEI